jgi:hypothetical protein
MLFPLGTACKVREAVQRYLNVNTLETQMFDWIVSNFKTILYFVKNIDTPLIADDFIDTNTHPYGHRIIHHKKVRFESIHDCNYNNSYEYELPLFLEKYNRRLNRLKSYIVNNRKIDFIHLVDISMNDTHTNLELYIPSVTEISEFFKCVKKINPLLKFKLHILIPPQNCRVYNTFFNYDIKQLELLKINRNVFIHFLSQDENIEPHREQCQHWSWYEIFEKIK